MNCEISSRTSLDDAMPAPRRILVIEDSPGTADALGRLLESMGQQVRVAHSGETGLRIAREQRPQIAFVDLVMPGISGSEVAQRLRQELPSSELTLVALSGYPHDHPSFQDTPFERHLLKPATAESIVTLLNSLPAEQHGR
jgi:CheY-like chemotaxis protein